VGFLDRAKKLAEQAKDAAEQAKKMAEQAASRASDAMTEAANRAEPPVGMASPDSTAVSSSPHPSGGGGVTASRHSGTPYLPGMLRRPGWRERGLTDPAALLPIQERDRVGVPHSTKSEILEAPYGMGRRWSTDGRSAGLFYQLYPEHRAWEPPGGRTAFTSVIGASAATLPDGRHLVFLGGGGTSVVLEIAGIDESAQAALAQTVSERLASA
jgi:hypothetical protein